MNDWKGQFSLCIAKYFIMIHLFYVDSWNGYREDMGLDEKDLTHFMGGRRIPMPKSFCLAKSRETSRQRWHTGYQSRIHGHCVPTTVWCRFSNVNFPAWFHLNRSIFHIMFLFLLIFLSYVVTVCTCFSHSHPGGFHIIHQPLIPQLSYSHQNYTPMELYQHVSTIINSSIPSPSVESVEPFRGPRIKNASSTRPL